MRMEEAEVLGKRQAFAYKFQVRLCSSVYFTCSLGFLSFKMRYHQMCISHFLYTLLKNMFIWRKKGISKNAEMRMCAIFFLSLKFWKHVPDWYVQVESSCCWEELIQSFTQWTLMMNVSLCLCQALGRVWTIHPWPLPLPSYCWQSRHFTYIIFNTHNSSC